MTNPRYNTRGRTSDQRSVRSFGILLILMLGCILVQPAWAKWTPAKPTAPVVRVYLRDSQQPVTTSREQRQSYFLVEPGDTLTFHFFGRGNAQIQSRPIYREEENTEFFRYSVSFDSISRRNFKRRSAIAGVVDMQPVRQTAATRAVLVGNKDKLIIEVPAGSNSLQIFMNPKDARSAFVRVLFDEGLLQQTLQPSVFKPSGEFRRTIRVSPGSYDSNVYLAPKDRIASQGAAYWPLDANFLYRSRPTRRLVLDSQYRFSGEFHEQSLLDESSHTVEFEQRLRVTKPRSRRFTVALRERWRYRSTTFFGRGEQEEFESLQNGEPVSLAGRFDYNETQVQGRIDTELNPRILATTRISYTNRNYRKDFSDYPDLYALDNSRLAFRMGVQWRATSRLRIDVDTTFRLKDYREKFARDSQGNQRIDQPTSLSDRKLSAQLRLAARSGFQLGLEVAGDWTFDRFENYWDHSTVRVSSMAGWKWKHGNGLRLKLSRSVDSYKNATVGYDPSQPLREKTTLRLGVDAQYVLTPRVSLALIYDYLDQDNNSPLFAYSRWQFSNGFIVRY